MVNKKIKSNVDNMISLIQNYDELSTFIRKSTLRYIKEILDIIKEEDKEYIDLSDYDVCITYNGDCNTAETFYASFIRYDENENIVVGVDSGEPFILEDLSVNEMCDIWNALEGIFEE